MSELGIVIPVANEQDTIERFLLALLDVTRQWDTSIYLVMDSYSKDRTEGIIRRMAAAYPQIRPVFFEKSKGAVSCYLHGFRLALADGCKYIIEMDSGFSHPPARVPEFMHALTEENYEVAFGSRFMRGAAIRNFPLKRRIISGGGSWLANLWLGTKYSDATSGFQAFQAHVLANMNFDNFISDGGIYQTEMKYYCRNCRYKEIPFVYVGSTTNFKLKWILKALQSLFKMKRNERRVLINSSNHVGALS